MLFSDRFRDPQNVRNVRQCFGGEDGLTFKPTPARWPFLFKLTPASQLTSQMRVILPRSAPCSLDPSDSQFLTKQQRSSIHPSYELLFRGSSFALRYSSPSGPIAATCETYSPDFAQWKWGVLPGRMITAPGG
jgi:hypothetical protein